MQFHRIRRILGLLIVCCWSATAVAQDEPLLDSFQRRFKTEPLNIGLLLQVVGDFQPDRSFAGENGFSVANFRLNMRGNLDGGFGYMLQTSFTRSPAILDAALRYEAAPALTVTAGAFKAPFSSEFLTSAADIDFVNRSQVVSALVPGRQIGVQASGRAGDSGLHYAVGAFNGNGVTANGNDDDDLMYVGRVTAERVPETADDVQIRGGAHVAWSRDRNATLGGGFVRGFNGERALFGADLRLTHRRWLASGEFVWSHLDFEAAPNANPFGSHLTLGYFVRGRDHVLARWDRFLPDGVAADSDLLILGYNHYPTGPTELQVNWIFPTRESFDNQQILINIQISL